MLPTFLVIGAMKCATTSLHGYLAQHPHVFMSGPKELNFFSDEARFERGVAWYASQFPDNRPIRGETSPNYTKRHLFPDTANRIARLLPDASLIYIVRHPVARFLSNYVHAVARGRETRSLNELLRAADRNYSVLFDTGRYMFQLEAYLEHFPPARIRVLRMEDLETRHCAVVQEALTFLGADPSLHPHSDTGVRLHESASKRKPRRWTRLLAASGRPGNALLRRLPAALTSSPIGHPRLSLDQRRQLMDNYAEDIHRLERFAGRSMEWF